MVEQYRELSQYGTGEIIEKKSRFIANVFPIQSEEDAIEQIGKLKKQYWDARHNCYAYSLGVEQPVLRFSDDGEPQGTAGKPILEVITGQEIHNILIVVTRYFGGTLLGTGGLVRAYQGAAKEGLANSVIETKMCCYEVKMEMDYTDFGKIQYLLGEHKIDIADSVYEEKVTIVCFIPCKEWDMIEKELNDAAAGRVQWKKEEQKKFLSCKR